MDVAVAEVAPGVWHARAKHVSWVLLVDGGEVTLVDTGYPGDRDRVIESLTRIGRSPSDVAAVILTHAHPDHLGSAEHFRTTHHTPVMVHTREVPNATGQRIEQVSIGTLLSKVWRPDVAVWARDVVALRAATVERLGDVGTFDAGPLDLPGRPVGVAAPGHTSGHTVFHLPERGALLAGDALMTDHALVRAAGPQLLPSFFNHDNEQAAASLQVVAGLEADVVVPGHGPAFRGSPAAAAAAAVAAAAPGAPPARLSYGAVLPLAPDDAFAFLSDPLNWPRFFSSLRECSKAEDWGSVGGRASMTASFLGRAVTSELEMTVWDPPRRFAYVARQEGAPALLNDRVLQAVPGGTRLRGTTELRYRGGLPGVFDRLQLQALRRVYSAAMTALPDAAQSVRGSIPD